MRKRTNDGQRSPKVLVLGGAQQHCKLVEAAREYGVESVVVDYIDDSPAKRLADESYRVDVRDTEHLAALCARQNVSGVVAGWLDPCQLPYRRLCERIGARCYGSEKAFAVMTDKELFKRCCESFGVGTVPFVCGEPDEVLMKVPASDLSYPLFVKPVDSRGSRGQAICNDEVELRCSVRVAASESSNGRVMVERYMGDADDISVTYLFAGGEAFLERFSDRLLGRTEDGLSNVCVGTVSPSKYLGRFMEEAHERVVAMLVSLDIVDGPVFMQGFVDEEGFYFYDPGLRFPGGDYERALKEATGVDMAREMVGFSLGDPLCKPEKDLVRLGGKVEVIHDVCLRPGVIKAIEGVEEVEAIEGVVSVNLRYGVGDVVDIERTVRRRFAEINFLANGYAEALEKSRQIQDLLFVGDEEGDMKISPFSDAFASWYDSYCEGETA